ncbi:hypothetical protein TREMEDRAFT_66555 [Tremella mesenterica DSM 1558]|uniref:uncharacterized protein n=1 Tax=Tremella mesenterica (strain ATCC 24925 / CBS 8224 / DSM 1558 / NBRC 9311 / NRRL Y-6157 / RJB 2259-6 / UBC 559-6) TaxID=578456 RepID=UPI00032CDEA9|nr:uncharacterized protein TREMEDRAFT_66555 [Tremella mesenterica DSM 1558]EIW65431.1 hypothetical protein TREMEDRAFT_66555 [Tremella mesenterica DSM 1558]
MLGGVSRRTEKDGRDSGKLDELAEVCRPSIARFGQSYAGAIQQMKSEALERPYYDTITRLESSESTNLRDAVAVHTVAIKARAELLKEPEWRYGYDINLLLQDPYKSAHLPGQPPPSSKKWQSSLLLRAAKAAQSVLSNDSFFENLTIRKPRIVDNWRPSQGECVDTSPFSAVLIRQVVNYKVIVDELRLTLPWSQTMS